MPAGVGRAARRARLALLTVSVLGCRSKLAVTVVVAVRVTVQEPVPGQPRPVQPVKVEPVAGAAGGGTAGALVTVPRPAPALLTVSVLGCRSKLAVTVVVAGRVTVQEPVPEQPLPLQPVQVEPGAGAPVRVPAVPVE